MSKSFLYEFTYVMTSWQVQITFKTQVFTFQKIACLISNSLNVWDYLDINFIENNTYKGNT
jgi:hypothetical protein